jgi:hypothetical protein
VCLPRKSGHHPKGRALTQACGASPLAGLLVRGQRLFVAAKGTERVPLALPGVGVAGVELDGLLERGERFFVVVLVKKVDPLSPPDGGVRRPRLFVAAECNERVPLPCEEASSPKG